jgi:hypothetical protein
LPVAVAAFFPLVAFDEEADAPAPLLLTVPELEPLIDPELSAVAESPLRLTLGLGELEGVAEPAALQDPDPEQLAVSDEVETVLAAAIVILPLPEKVQVPFAPGSYPDGPSHAYGCCQLNEADPAPIPESADQ